MKFRKQIVQIELNSFEITVTELALKIDIWILIWEVRHSGFPDSGFGILVKTSSETIPPICLAVAALQSFIEAWIIDAKNSGKK